MPGPQRNRGKATLKFHNTLYTSTWAQMLLAIQAIHNTKQVRVGFSMLLQELLYRVLAQTVF